MKKLARIEGLAILAILAISILAGCGSYDSPACAIVPAPQTPHESTTQTQTIPAGALVEFHFAHNSDARPIVNFSVNTFSSPAFNCFLKDVTSDEIIVGAYNQGDGDNTVTVTVAYWPQRAVKAIQ